jgi:hypothetical protein
MSAFPGYAVVDGFIDADRADQILRSIQAYAGLNAPPLVQRESGRRPLQYRVIDGLAIRDHLPRLEALSREVNGFVNELTGAPLAPMQNPQAQLNVNITPPGGSYRWHYDRNAVTALLYLNGVDGGRTELCPNYRVGRGRTSVARLADRVLGTPVIMRVAGRKVSIEPVPGRLLVMNGQRSLHSVTAVRGGADRVNVVMSFDDDEVAASPGDELDTYLYSSQPVSAAIAQCCSSITNRECSSAWRTCR